MWLPLYLQTACMLLVVVASEKQVGAEKTVSITTTNNNKNETKNSNPVVAATVSKISGSSEEPSPKVPRHLAPTKLQKLFGIKPLFNSRIIGDKQMILVKKVVSNKPDEITSPDGIRYSPRSLDMGLMNYNNLDLYSNQGVAPTSGIPNSLDHLYLPEISAKDYAKPLPFNGIGNPPLIGAEASTGEFDYQKPYPIHDNFRHPFEQRPKVEQYRGLLQRKVKLGARHPYEHGHNENRGPPVPPHKVLENSPQNIQEDSNDESNHSDNPPGYEQVEGDAGIRGILDLANLINSNNGFAAQLSNIQSTNFQGLQSSPQPGGHPHFNEDDDSEGNTRPLNPNNEHFRYSPVPNRGGRHHSTRRPINQGDEDNNFDYDNAGPPGYGRGESGPGGRFGTPNNYGRDSERNEHYDYPSRSNNNREERKRFNNRPDFGHGRRPGPQPFDIPRRENDHNYYLNDGDGQEDAPAPLQSDNEVDFDFTEDEEGDYDGPNENENSSSDFPYKTNAKDKYSNHKTVNGQNSSHRRPYDDPEFENDFSQEHFDSPKNMNEGEIGANKNNKLPFKDIPNGFHEFLGLNT